MLEQAGQEKGKERENSFLPFNTFSVPWEVPPMLLLMGFKRYKCIFIIKAYLQDNSFSLCLSYVKWACYVRSETLNLGTYSCGVLVPTVKIVSPFASLSHYNLSILINDEFPKA